MEAPPADYPSALFVNRSSLEKHFECLICSNIQKDPVLCTGGHGYCRSCIVKWKQDKSPTCPTCQVSLDTLVPNRAVESNILESLVYCYTRLPSLTAGGTGDNDNDDEEEENNQSSSSGSSSSGAAAGEKRKNSTSSKSSKKTKARIDHCTWKGMLKDATEHFSHCAFAGTKCDFEGCDVVKARSELVEHRHVCVHRTLICKWDGCVEQLKAAEMEQHQLVCQKRVVKCPNAESGCRKKNYYENLTQHRAECLYEMCACPFADVGCTARLLRNEIDKHEDDECKRHNRLLLRTVKKQRQAHASLKDHVMPDIESIVLHVKHDVLSGKESFVPRFASLPSRLYSEDHVVRGYKASIFVETKGTKPECQDYYGVYLELTGGGPFLRGSASRWQGCVGKKKYQYNNLRCRDYLGLWPDDLQSRCCIP